MADDGQRIEVAIAANIRGLIEGLTGATDAVKSATGQMSSQLEALGTKIAGVGKAIAAFGALMAGGKMFKDAIEHTIAWNMEVDKLSRTLGIIPQDASVLKVALHGLGISTDTYLTANRMMIRQINAGGQGFKDLGISIKDANGNLRPSTELMTEAVEKIRALKSGTDQQAAGLAVFGRGWAEVAGLLRLTKERAEEARKEAEELHLVVGPEGVAKTREYQEGLWKLNLIGESLQIQIGSALMPVLRKLGQFFGDIGPGLAMVLSGALKILVTNFYLLKFAIESVVAWVEDFFLNAIEGFKTIASVMGQLIKGNFSGAIAEAKAGGNRLANITKESVQIQKDLWADLKKNIAETWNPPAAKMTGPQGPDARFNPDKGEKDKKESRVGAWELELKAQEEALAAIAAKNGQFYEKDRAEELRFWQAKLALTEKGSQEQVAIQNKILGIKTEGYKADLDEKKAQLENEIAAERVNLGRKLELTKQELAMYAVGSKGYEAARRKVVQVEREISQELNALMRQRTMFQHDLDLKTIEGEEATLAFRKEMGQVAQDEEYAAEVAFEDRKLKIKQDAINAELAQNDLTKEKTQELLNQKYMLEVEHDQKLAALRNQMAEKERANMLAFFAPLTQAFQGAMEQLLAGTITWAQAVKQIWKGLGQVIDQMIVKMVMSYVTGKQKEVMAEQWATIQKVAIQTWGAIKSVALAVWAGIKWVAVKGYEAAAGAYSAIASIPFVGPFLAPAVAAGVLAAVLGMGSKIASAAGGWDRIPSDQIAQLHKNEMVLPAHLAERIRNMTGDEEGGRDERRNVSITIQAMDGQDVHRVLTKHQDSLFRIFREGGRNGRL